MKQQNLFLFLLIAVLCHCTSPEGKFQKAVESRSKKAFEQFIEEYPESDLVDQAKQRIEELSYWEKIDSSLTKEPYQTYIDSFPNPLFANEVQDRLQEIRAFREAQDKDIIDAYSSFSEKYPASLFTDSLMKRVEYLKPAQQGFQAMKSETSTIALKAYLKEFRDTGYGKLIQSRLDSVALEEAASLILNKSNNKSLPKTLDELIGFIEKTENKEAQQLKNAKKALEDILIEQIKILGYVNRFTLTKVEVNSLEKGSRYTIIANENASELTLTPEYPGDNMNFGGMMLFGMNVGTPSLNSYSYFTHGTIWRIKGTLSNLFGYNILGTYDDPISFYLIKGTGAVYLHGQGEVKDKDGKIIFSTKDFDVYSQVKQISR